MSILQEGARGTLARIQPAENGEVIPSPREHPTRKVIYELPDGQEVAIGTDDQTLLDILRSGASKENPIDGDTLAEAFITAADVPLKDKVNRYKERRSRLGPTLREKGWDIINSANRGRGQKAKYYLGRVEEPSAATIEPEERVIFPRPTLASEPEALPQDEHNIGQEEEVHPRYSRRVYKRTNRSWAGPSGEKGDTDEGLATASAGNGHVQRLDTLEPLAETVLLLPPGPQRLARYAEFMPGQYTLAPYIVNSFAFLLSSGIGILREFGVQLDERKQRELRLNGQFGKEVIDLLHSTFRELRGALVDLPEHREEFFAQNNNRVRTLLECLPGNQESLIICLNRMYDLVMKGKW